MTAHLDGAWTTQHTRPAERAACHFALRRALTCNGTTRQRARGALRAPLKAVEKVLTYSRLEGGGWRCGPPRYLTTSLSRRSYRPLPLRLDLLACRECDQLRGALGAPGRSPRGRWTAHALRACASAYSKAQRPDSPWSLPRAGSGVRWLLMAVPGGWGTLERPLAGVIAVCLFGEAVSRTAVAQAPAGPLACAGLGRLGRQRLPAPAPRRRGSP
jgi:hypothetical protein